MKNTVLFLALFTLGTILSAEEWKTSRRSLWEAEGENHYSCNLSGTEKKWNVIGLKKDLEPEKFYRLSFFSKGECPKDSLRIGIIRADKNRLNFRADLRKNWTKHQQIFYSKAGGLAELIFSLPKNKKCTAEIRGIELAEVPESELTGNLYPEGDAEDSAIGTGNWNLLSHELPDLLSIEPNKDFLAGEWNFALKISPVKKGAVGIKSRYIPITPGKKYRFSFWAKANRKTGLHYIISLWSPEKHSGKHFWKRSLAVLSTEWMPYSMEVEIPDDLEKYPDLAGRILYLCFRVPNNQETAEIRLDDIVFEETDGTKAK